MTHLLLALALSSAAHAGDAPEVSVQDDGTVVGRVLVDAPSDQVRAVIPQLQSDASASTSVLSVSVHPDADCQAIFRQTRGLWSPFEMRTRLCPTSKGWRETLVQSDDYDAYEVEWTLEPQGTGTLVSMKVKSEIALSVPTSLVRSGQVTGVNESFKALLQRLFAKKSAK